MRWGAELILVAGLLSSCAPLAKPGFERSTQAQLAFVSAGSDGVHHIFTSNGQLTFGPAPDDYPNWSPDGSALVFYRTQAGASIYRVNADGTGLTRLSSGLFDKKG